ncbi:uncharacterized protein LOC131949264 [Physella acuta]|uniref:uncharacterized protein LOC131949264 n=1 Tax=Physella acuta TaxID=109671 RepID=UPI0027DCE85A|nr:uncharacterized protein LOC131949264 [Physella acuta]
MSQPEAGVSHSAGQSAAVDQIVDHTVSVGQTVGHPTTDHPTSGHQTFGHTTSGHQTFGQSTVAQSAPGQPIDGQLTAQMTASGTAGNHVTGLQLLKEKLLGDNVKPCMGMCMIAFAIPLLVPGVTLTVVAMEDETGFSKFSALHVIGMLILAAAIMLLVVGIVLNIQFQSKVSPDTDVSTHEKGAGLEARLDSRGGYHPERDPQLYGHGFVKQLQPASYCVEAGTSTASDLGCDAGTHSEVGAARLVIGAPEVAATSLTRHVIHNASTSLPSADTVNPKTFTFPPCGSLNPTTTSLSSGGKDITKTFTFPPGDSINTGTTTLHSDSPNGNASLAEPSTTIVPNSSVLRGTGSLPPLPNRQGVSLVSSPSSQEVARYSSSYDSYDTDDRSSASYTVNSDRSRDSYNLDLDPRALSNDALPVLTEIPGGRSSTFDNGSRRTDIRKSDPPSLEFRQTKVIVPQHRNSDCSENLLLRKDSHPNSPGSRPRLYAVSSDTIPHPRGESSPGENLPDHRNNGSTAGSSGSVFPAEEKRTYQLHESLEESTVEGDMVETS